MLGGECYQSGGQLLLSFMFILFLCCCFHLFVHFLSAHSFGFSLCLQFCSASLWLHVDVIFILRVFM